MNFKKCDFVAIAAKGHHIKVAIDTLAGPIKRGKLCLTEKGIYLREADETMTMLFDIFMPRESFRKYECKFPQAISINIKHFQKQLKNIRKKDSISLFVNRTDEDRKDMLGITIRPEGTTDNKPNLRFETNYLKFKTEDNLDLIEIPDPLQYHYPMVIDSSGFQKIKRITTDNKIVKSMTIRMHKNKYLSFISDGVGVYTSELGFGGLDDDDDEDENYIAQFYVSKINMLIKLPALNPQMQFFAPKDSSYPLKINTYIGSNGTFQAFIKDIARIKFEEGPESVVEEPEEPVKVKKTKKKSTPVAQTTPRRKKGKEEVDE